MPTICIPKLKIKHTDWDSNKFSTLILPRDSAYNQWDFLQWFPFKCLVRVHTAWVLLTHNNKKKVVVVVEKKNKKTQKNQEKPN